MKILAIVIALLLCSPALAWSECGHHIIALMAFDQLPPERKAELLRILKEHPRYAEDFKVPRGVKNENNWLIGRAGYWPDVVRSGSGKPFSRPTWHYQLGACDVIGKVREIVSYRATVRSAKEIVRNFGMVRERRTDYKKRRALPSLPAWLVCRRVYI